MDQSEAESRGSAPWPTLATVTGAVVAVWGASIGWRTIADNSFFTHLATGRVILDGTFPRSDIYSHTAAGEPWVVQSWLPSILYAWLESWFGIVGIQVVTGFVAGLIGLLAWQLTRPAASLIARLGCCALFLAIGSSLWSPRPLLIGLLCLAVTLMAAERRLAPAVLLPLFWVWGNSHGSFPLGVVALGCLYVGARLDGADTEVEQRCLVFAGSGSLLAMVGPLGLDVVRFPIALLSRADVLTHVVEWKSPSFSEPWARIFLLQIAISVLLLVRRPSYRVAVPLVVFVAAALLGLRNVPMASLVLLVGMAATAKGLGSLEGRESGAIARVGLALVVCAGLVLGVVSLGQGPVDLTDYPVDAIAWMDANDLPGPGQRLVTPETVGNYLELVKGTDAQVFLDDRVDMYPDTVIEDYLVLHEGRSGWASVLDRNETDLVLWPRDRSLEQLLLQDASWQTVYQDGEWTLSCRRGSCL